MGTSPAVVPRKNRQGIPPPPPGFLLGQPQNIPPPPPGFVLDKPSAGPSPEMMEAIQSVPREPLQQPGLLEPRPGEGAITSGLKGVGRVGAGLLRAPYEIGSAFLGKPQTPEEAVARAATPLAGGAGQAVQRLLVAPQMEMARRSREAAEAGDPLSTHVYAGASALPVIGPVAGELYGRARGGDVAGAIGEAVALAALPAIGRTGGRVTARTLQRLRAPMAKRMAQRPVEAANVPAEKFTRVEIVKEAQKQGIELTPAQATGSKPIQTIQAVGERSLLGGGRLQEFLDVNRAKLIDWTERFGKRLDPKKIAESTESAGAYLKQSTQKAMDVAKAKANAAFAKTRGWTEKTRVNVSGLRKRFAEELQSIEEALANEPAQYATPVRKMLEKVAAIGGAEETIVIGGRATPVSQLPAAMRKQLGVTEPKGISFATAQRLRSDFWDMGNDFTGTIPNRVQSYARQVTKELDTAMQRSAQLAGPKVYKQWRSANAQWKKLKEMYDDRKSPLYRILQEPDAAKVPQKVLAQGNYGGSLRTIRMLKEQKFDLGPLKREILNQIRDRNFGLTRNRLAGYSDAYLRELFTSQELSELYKMGKIARSVRFEVNPSGTSNVGGAMYELHGIAKGVAYIPGVHYGAARFSRSPAMRRKFLSAHAPGPSPQAVGRVGAIGAPAASVVGSAHRQSNRTRFPRISRREP